MHEGDWVGPQSPCPSQRKMPAPAVPGPLETSLQLASPGTTADGFGKTAAFQRLRAQEQEQSISGVDPKGLGGLLPGGAPGFKAESQPQLLILRSCPTQATGELSIWGSPGDPNLNPGQQMNPQKLIPCLADHRAQGPLLPCTASSLAEYSFSVEHWA